LNKIRIATRKSPLALVQANLVAARAREVLGVETELVTVVTTGDRQAQWSLEVQGGKGLFTGELEQLLLRGEADIAVHSTKDLPGAMTAGLAVAGYLPRADPHDVLVRRVGVAALRLIATASPRRRLQSAIHFPEARHTEIRGNVDTRLRKTAAGLADATILAAAGLARLGIAGWPGLEFEAFALDRMVPAVGQGAIAVQCRAGEGGRFAAALDPATSRRVDLERALQTLLGGGCHTAFAAHATEETLYIFHESIGVRVLPLAPDDFDAPTKVARRILSQLRLIND